MLRQMLEVDEVGGSLDDLWGIGWIVDWLPFVNSYRTLCLAPTTALRKVFEDLRRTA
jgi:hypothetical protein